MFNGLSGSTRGSGAILIGGNHTNIYNNTIYGWTSGLVLFRSGSQNNIIKNNIFSNNTSDLSIDVGSGYPTNNSIETNYFGSNTKCTNCTDYTGSGGPNLSTLDDAPPNTYSSSPWTQFSYNFTKASTGSTTLSFINDCGGGVYFPAGTIYLDDISIVPSGGGSEKILNGGMEGAYSSGIAPNWTSAAGIVGTEENTIIHSGSSSQKLTTSGSCGQKISQNVTLTAGDYTLTGWAKVTSGTSTLPIYINSTNTSSLIGTLGPTFLGSVPYTSATDFKLDSLGTDFSLVVDVGVDLGASNRLGLNSLSSTWPLSTINQIYFGSGWDMGAFIYNNDSTAPITTDNVDSNWHNSSVTVSLSCSDSSGSGCSNTYYTTDGTTPTTSSSQGNSIVLNSSGTYTIKYFSVDNAGNSESIKTSANQVKVDVTLPAISSVLSSSNTSDATITWLTDESSSSIVEYGLSNSYGNTTTETDVSTRVLSHSVSLSGLSDCSTYQYRVRSKDSVSNEAVSGNYSFRTFCLPGPQMCNEAKPLGVRPWLQSAISNSSDSIILKFVNYQSPITNFVIEYGTKSGEYKYSVDNINKDMESYVIKKLNPSTTYFFRLRASNNCATGSWSNEITAKTKGYVSFNQFNFIESEVATEIADNSCQTYSVQVGDNLWKIAKNLLGDGMKYKEIIELNKDVYQTLRNSSQLENGWKLKIKCGDDEKNEGYNINVKVLNKNNEPVKGAKVTLHSDPKETITNENGVAHFTNVESGNHKVIIAYNSFEGEQSVNLSGDAKEINLNIMVKENTVMFSKTGWLIVAIMSLVIFVLVFTMVKNN